MSFTLLLQKISIIFLEILLGIVGQRCGKISEKDTKYLSDLLMTFFLPCTVLAGAASEGADSAVGVLFLSIGMFLFLFISSTFGCRLLSKLLGFTWQREAVLVSTAAMPNNGFIGLPMAAAVMGSKGLVFGVASIAAYNLWFFTYVESLFHKGHKLKFRELITPCNVCTLILLIMLATGIRLPSVAQDVCSAVGACTTPVALMVVGAMLGRSDIRALAVRPFLYLVTALRNLAFPLIFIFILWLLPLSNEVRLGLAILSSSPSGTLSAVLARQNDVEETLCSQSVAHSTLFMAATMPAMILLALYLFPMA